MAKGFSFEPIAVMRTVFRQKFGIPRQPGLVPEATGTLEFPKSDRLRTALRGLEQFSHLWVVYVFHETGAELWKPSVRPPRLGGAKKMGVLASRSPHRPNPIGLSVVKILNIDLDHRAGPRIEVEGVDMLDGTPVLDIKPYVPYADSVKKARSGWAPEAPKRHRVAFLPSARKKLTSKAQEKLIRRILSLDPRPAFQQRKGPSGDYGIWVGDVDVKWKIDGASFVVTDLVSQK